MALLEGSLKVTGSIEAGRISGLREECRITGDGVKKSFDVCHSLGVRLVDVKLYDSLGCPVYAAVRCADETTVNIMFGKAPDMGETFDAVFRK